MIRSARFLVAVAMLTAAWAGPANASGSPAMPADHHSLTRTISFAEMESFLASVDGKGPVNVSVEGKTTKGRAIYLVHLGRSAKPDWTILFYAQQHGDEVSGKDALLYLIRDVVEKPGLLPEGVDLWIMPMMNPDGAEAGTRVNGAGADINRDHIALEQPETAALHRVVQRLHPDVAVDCHEFARESEGYAKKGWMKWPDITMDALNNPLFDASVRQVAGRIVEDVGKAEQAAGHPFLRYWVGGTPPDEEQRHSAPDIDSGMNAVGAYGGLSFIIEAAARRGSEATAKELGSRVDAYLVAIRLIVQGDGNRGEAKKAIAAAKGKPIAAFLPVNYFWANPDGEVTMFPVREISTGRAVEVPTPNMMTRLVVKASVPSPAAYAVEPRAAGRIGELLAAHGIVFETLAAPRTVLAETSTLVRVENDFDDVYSRYEGRQIVRRGEVAKRELLPGTLWVPLKGDGAIRAALLLEPSSLYGLFQYPSLRALVGPDGAIPVIRVRQ